MFEQRLTIFLETAGQASWPCESKERRRRLLALCRTGRSSQRRRYSFNVDERTRYIDPGPPSTESKHIRLPHVYIKATASRRHYEHLSISIPFYYYDIPRSFPAIYKRPPAPDFTCVLAAPAPFASWLARGRSKVLAPFAGYIFLCWVSAFSLQQHHHKHYCCCILSSIPPLHTHKEPYTLDQSAAMSSAQDLLNTVVNSIKALSIHIFHTITQQLENLSEALDLQEIELATLRAVNDDLSTQLTARDQTITALSAENAQLRQTAYHRKPICVACWLSGDACDAGAQCRSCVRAGKACERKKCGSEYCSRPGCPRVHPREWVAEQRGWVVTEGVLPYMNHQRDAAGRGGEGGGVPEGGYWQGDVVAGQ